MRPESGGTRRGLCCRNTRVSLRETRSGPAMSRRARGAGPSRGAPPAEASRPRCWNVTGPCCAALDTDSDIWNPQKLQILGIYQVYTGHMTICRI